MLNRSIKQRPLRTIRRSTFRTQSKQRRRGFRLRPLSEPHRSQPPLHRRVTHTNSNRLLTRPTSQQLSITSRLRKRHRPTTRHVRLPSIHVNQQQQPSRQINQPLSRPIAKLPNGSSPRHFKQVPRARRRLFRNRYLYQVQGRREPRDGNCKQVPSKQLFRQTVRQFTFTRKWRVPFKQDRHVNTRRVSPAINRQGRPSLRSHLQRKQGTRVQRPFKASRTKRPLRRCLRRNRTCSRQTSKRRQVQQELPNNFSLRFNKVSTSIIPITRRLRLQRPMLLRNSIPHQQLFRIHRRRPLKLLPINLNHVRRLRQGIPRSRRNHLRPRTRNRLKAGKRRPHFKVHVPSTSMHRKKVKMPIQRRRRRKRRRHRSKRPRPRVKGRRTIKYEDQSKTIPRPTCSHHKLMPRSCLQPITIHQRSTFIKLLRRRRRCQGDPRSKVKVRAPSQRFRRRGLPLSSQFRRHLRPRRNTNTITRSKRRYRYRLLWRHLCRRGQRTSKRTLQLCLQESLRVQQLQRHQQRVNPRDQRSQRQRQPFKHTTKQHTLPQRRQQQRNRYQQLCSRQAQATITRKEFRRRLQVLQLQPRHLFPVRLQR